MVQLVTGVRADVRAILAQDTARKHPPTRGPCFSAVLFLGLRRTATQPDEVRRQAAFENCRLTISPRASIRTIPNFTRTSTAPHRHSQPCENSYVKMFISLQVLLFFCVACPCRLRLCRACYQSMVSLSHHWGGDGGPTIAHND